MSDIINKTKLKMNLTEKLNRIFLYFLDVLVTKIYNTKYRKMYNR